MNYLLLFFIIFKIENNLPSYHRQVVYYHIVTYEVPDEQACADHHVKCCRDHIEIAGNCLGNQLKYL